MELLCTLKLDELQKLRLAEIDKFIEELYWLPKRGHDRNGATNVALCEWFRGPVINIMTRTVGSRSHGYGTKRDAKAEKV
ncbi:hypothetical protein Ancab_033975, partial [Ancistrocladus abbreviatus]